MALSIYNLIESVCNPAGRFKTLREIGVKTDEKGDPVFSYSGTTISFSVVWKGRSYLLKCSLREEQENTLSWRRIAAYPLEIGGGLPPISRGYVPRFWSVIII